MGKKSIKSYWDKLNIT